MSSLVIAALVLGIGANTAVFSIVNAVLLRPLPVLEPERIVRIYAKVNATGTSLGISYPEYLDWKTQCQSFEAISVMRSFAFTLTGSGAPEHLKGISISPSGFAAFGVSPTLGRAFTEADDRADAPPVVVLNHAFWQRKFGGDSRVLGKPITLDDKPYTIIGVLQATNITMLEYPDVWLPNVPFVDQYMMDRERRFYFPAARLKRSVTRAQAQAEMETIARRLAAAYPASNKDMGINLVGMADLLTEDDRRPLAYLLLASSTIFLLACVNLIMVSVATAVERSREFALRLALGATHLHLLRQLLIQAFLFAATGSLLAFVVANLGLTFFLRRFPDAILRLQETTIDYRVIGVMVGMALVISIMTAVAPVLYASKLNITNSLKDESSWFKSPRHRAFTQGALIAAQVALATALSLVAGLLIKSFYHVSRTDLGFDPHRVLSFRVDLPPSRYQDDPQQASFYKTAIEKLSHTSGVAEASGISNLPLTNRGGAMNLQVDSDSPSATERPYVEDESVLPGFFHTMRIPLLKGRDFADTDRSNSTPVVIVDEVLAARFWPGQDPIGKRLRLAPVSDTTKPWREIIGVVRQIKDFGPEARVVWPQAYVPQYQEPTQALSFVINTSIAQASAQAAVQKAIHALDPELPADDFRAMDELLDKYMAGRKISILLLGGFSALGIALGSIGIYGMASNAVIRRRREVAIRMALGATSWQSTFIVIRLCLVSTIAGITVGFGAVICLTRVLASFLSGVTALDPAVYLLSAGLIAILALIACIVPARAIFCLNPQEALRE